MREKQGRFRPSPALALAFIALVLGAVGGVYAAQKIDGSTIRKQSIPPNRIKGTFNTGMVKANESPSFKLLKKLGPFRIVAKCDGDVATVYMRSTVDEASMDSDEGDELDNADFDAGIENQISYEADEASDRVAFYSNDYNGWIVVGPNGKQVYRGDAYSARSLGAGDCKFLVVGERLK